MRNFVFAQSFPLICLLIFWGCGLAGLDRLPTVHQDEAWTAAPGYTFWSEGRFGTDLFAGFGGMDAHYFQFMPLFSLIVGGWLRLSGLGLFQARLVSLAAALLTLALTYRLGGRLFSRTHGALAVMLLVFWKIAVPQTERHLHSGIPLADIARITRYDVLVPVFGLLALNLAVRESQRDSINERDSSYPCAVMGMAVGLAALSHLYGAFWLPVVMLVANQRRLRSLFSWRTVKIIIGFGLTLLPWLLFVATDVSDFVQQGRILAERFNLLSPDFYRMNVLREAERYQPVIDALTINIGAALGITFATFGLIFALLHVRQNKGVQTLVIALAVLCGLFALLLHSKMYNYLATIWPLLALLVAFTIVNTWRVRFIRPIMILAAALALGEGVLTYRDVGQTAAQTTAYRDYTAQIAAHIPQGSRVVAMQHYWFGLAGQVSDYRSLMVMFLLTNPEIVDQPISFVEAVEQAAPDVLLIDAVMLNFFNEAEVSDHPYHRLRNTILRYLRTLPKPIKVFDPAYGWMLIYHIPS